MMPNAIRMEPPMNQTETNNEVHPGIVFPWQYTTTPYTMTTTEIRMKSRPSMTM